MRKTVLAALTLAFLALATARDASAAALAPGAKVYLEPMGGFETYLAAAIEKKHVPVKIISDQSQAEFIISGVSESQKAGWAKILFTRSTASAEEASIVVKDVASGEVVFAYAVNKGNSMRGKQSAAEACAKHLKEKIHQEL